MDVYDLMISYSHTTRKFVLQIHDWLKEKGFKIWIDKDRLDTDMYKEIANGIDKSSVFLPCFSSGYENSKWCERELTYACEMKKKIVPLIVEKDYKLVNDLKLKVAGLCYFTFEEKDFDDAMNRVLRAVRKHINPAVGDGLDDVEKMLASSSIKENKVENSQVPDLILNSSPSFADGNIILQNEPVRTDDRRNETKMSDNNEEKFLKSIENDEVIEKAKEILNSPITAISSISAEEDLDIKRLSVQSYDSSTTVPNPSNNTGNDIETFLNDVSNPDEKSFVENILNSPVNTISGNTKLLDMLNNGNTIEDFYNSSGIKFREGDLADINNAQYGGGSVGIEFLNDLMQTKDIEKSEFENALNHSKVRYVDLKDNYSFISSMSFETKRTLGDRLSRNNLWAEVAYKLEYTQLEVEKVRLRQRRENNYCRASKLFEKISQRDPEYLVKNLMKFMHDVIRMDIYKELKLIILDRAKNSIKTT